MKDTDLIFPSVCFILKPCLDGQSSSKVQKQKCVLEALFIFASVNPNQTNTQTSTCCIHKYLSDISFATIALNKISETFLKIKSKIVILFEKLTKRYIPNCQLGTQKLGIREVMLCFFLFLLPTSSTHFNAYQIHIISSYPIVISIIQALFFNLDHVYIYLSSFLNLVLTEYSTLLPYIFLTVSVRVNFLSFKWTAYLYSAKNTFQ